MLADQTDAQRAFALGVLETGETVFADLRKLLDRELTSEEARKLIDEIFHDVSDKFSDARYELMTAEDLVKVVAGIGTAWRVLQGEYTIWQGDDADEALRVRKAQVDKLNAARARRAA